MNTGVLERINPLMTIINGRNQLADVIFYDVTSLTAKEWLSLGPWVDQKGGLLLFLLLKPKKLYGTMSTRWSSYLRRETVSKRSWWLVLVAQLLAQPH